MNIRRGLIAALFGGAGALASGGTRAGQGGPDPGSPAPSAPDFASLEGADIGAVLNAAMDRMARGGAGADGGMVRLPEGRFLTSRTVVVPNKVALTGAGRRATLLCAGPGFPPGAPLVRLGRASDQYAFDCYVADITLDCAGTEASVGLLLDRCQEGGGARRLNVANFRDVGLSMQGPGNANVFLEDIEIYSTGGDSRFGVEISGCSQVLIDKVTTYGAGVGRCQAGIRLFNTQVTGQGWHLEGSTDGVRVDGHNVTGAVSGIDASGGARNVENLVRFSGGEVRLSLYDLVKRRADCAIRNDRTGVRIDAPFVPDASAMTRAAYPLKRIEAGASPFTYRNSGAMLEQLLLNGDSIAAVDYVRGKEVGLSRNSTMIVLSPGDEVKVKFAGSLVVIVTNI